jgi:hypothetical protein
VSFDRSREKGWTNLDHGIVGDGTRPIRSRRNITFEYSKIVLLHRVSRMVPAIYGSDSHIKL